MRSQLGQRLRTLFRRDQGPPEEPVEMAPDPEWDELLAWAEVAPRAAPEGGGIMEMEQEDWSAAIAIAKRQADPQPKQPTAIARAPEPRSRHQDQVDWEAAIANAKRQAEQEQKKQVQQEQAEWQRAMASAKQQALQEQQKARQEQLKSDEAEEAEWNAIIEEAKQRPALRATPAHRPPPPRQQIDQHAWEERIARARRKPTPAASNANGAGPTLRDRLERLAARVGTPHKSPTLTEEEVEWRAAIARAKKGNA